MNNIKQLTDKELVEKKVQLAKIGEEITNKENQTDEDIAKIKDCREQIENISAEINKRKSLEKEVNESKQYFTKVKEEQNIEQRGEMYGTYITQRTDPMEKQALETLEILRSHSRRQPLKRCAMLMPTTMQNQNGIGICSRGEINSYSSFEESKSILKAMSIFSGLQKSEAFVESRAETFGMLSESPTVMPTVVSDEIIAQAMEITGLLNLCSTIYEVQDVKILKKDLSKDMIRVKKTVEREKLESHMYKYTDLYLKGDTIRSYAEVTNQLVLSSTFDALGEVVRDMADTFSYKLENSLFHPDEMGMTDADTFGFNGITEEVQTQTSEGITIHDLLELTGAVLNRYSRNAVLIMNQKTLNLLKHLEDSVGRLHLLPNIQVGQNMYHFDGHLILPVDSVDTFEAGKSVIYYGDLRGMAVKIGRKLRIKTKENLETDTQGVHGVLRYDARIKEPFKFAKLKIKEA